MFKHFLRAAAVAVVAVAALVSCQEKDPSEPSGKKVTVQGTVTDQETLETVIGATVTVAGVSTTTGMDGKYELKIDEVTAATKITASADKYADRSANLVPSDFTDGVATKDFALQFKGGVIAGLVINNNGQAVADVEVSLGTGVTVKTDAYGHYEFTGLVRDDYTVTFRSSDMTVTREVTKADFIAGTALIEPVCMDSAAVLPYGVTRNDLSEAPVLLYNIYSGGTGPWGNAEDFEYRIEDRGDHPAMRWLTAVWARKTMIGPSATEDEFYAAQSHLEDFTIDKLRTDILNMAQGFALRTRFLRQDTENYATYIYARKTIAAGNCKLGFHAQYMDHDAESNLYVGIVDLTASAFHLDETAITLGDAEGDYYNVDLSSYIGKEVAVIFGVKQLSESANHKSNWFEVFISTITFGPSDFVEDFELPGTEAKEGFGVTKESAATIGVLAPGTYTGKYNEEFRTEYVDELIYPMDFKCYAGTNSIYANFCFQYMNAIPDVAKDFTMRVNTEKSTETPSGVLYAKVAAGGSVTVNGNVIDGTLGYGFLVVTEDGTAEALEVKDGTGTVAAVCDLSKYSGNVLVGFCVYPRADADAAFTIDNIQIR